jgi:ribonuclease P protein component
MSIAREYRLRKHAEFELVYRCGRRHFSPVLTVFYVLREDNSSGSGSGIDVDGRTEVARAARVGITVGRALGKATTRNRIKRRVRAAVAENLIRIKRPVDVVINPKKVVQDVDFRELCSEVARAFDVIELKAVPAQVQAGGQKRPRAAREV